MGMRGPTEKRIVSRHRRYIACVVGARMSVCRLGVVSILLQKRLESVHSWTIVVVDDE